MSTSRETRKSEVLLEIEPEIAELFEEGMILDGHFFELKNGPWSTHASLGLGGEGRTI